MCWEPRIIGSTKNEFFPKEENMIFLRREIMIYYDDEAIEMERLKTETEIWKQIMNDELPPNECLVHVAAVFCCWWVYDS